MKMYTIPVGTIGKLIDQSGDEPIIRDWNVRRELSYFEVIVDPIRFHNLRGQLNLPPHIIRLAEQGYAIFGGDSGGEEKATYLLAVDYSHVDTL